LYNFNFFFQKTKKVVKLGGALDGRVERVTFQLVVLSNEMFDAMNDTGRPRDAFARLPRRREQHARHRIAVALRTADLSSPILVSIDRYIIVFALSTICITNGQLRLEIYTIDEFREWRRSTIRVREHAESNRLAPTWQTQYSIQKKQSIVQLL
jgi:hypothetical protein